MSNIKSYSVYNEEAKKPDYYRFVLNDIQIYMGDFLKVFKERFKLSCWVTYTNLNSVSLEYYQSSDISNENIANVKKFMFDKAPYFKDLILYRDDNRMVLKFFDVGDPIKFKFYY